MVWRCDVCRKEYPLKEEALDCEKICSKNRLYQCDICKKRYNSKNKATRCEKSHIKKKKAKPKKINKKEASRNKDKKTKKIFNFEKAEEIIENQNKESPNKKSLTEEIIPVNKEENIKEQIKLNENISEEDVEYTSQIFEEKKPKLINKEDVKKFLENQDLKSLKKIEEISEGIYAKRGCFDIFKKFIANTKERIDISTNVFSDKTLLELLNPLKEKGVKIRVISARQKEKTYECEKNFKGELEIFKLSKNHSKFIIRDNQILLTGSANLDESSMIDFFETNIITSKTEEVAGAKEIFDSLFYEKDLRKREKTNFLFSGETERDLPKSLVPLIKSEKEMTICVALSLFHKSVLDQIIKWNPNLKINIILGGSWPKNISNPVDKRTIDFINNYKKSSNLQITFKKEQIHSKVYLFKENEKMLVSSMNLTDSSWGRLLESGLLIEDKNQIDTFLEAIEELEDKEPPKETYVEINKRIYTPKEQEVITKNKLVVPWKTAYEDESWCFSKFKIGYRIKAVVNRKKGIKKTEENIEETSEYFGNGGRWKENFALVGHSTKTSYPSFTKSPIKGKKYNRKKDLEAQIITCKKKIEVSKNGEEREKWLNALKKIEEELGDGS